MNKTIFIVLINLVTIVCNGQNHYLKNASFWDGDKMINKDIYIIDSVISFSKPKIIDSIMDMTGKYVIPPFGDFHTHLFDGDYSKKNDTLFRSKGIFFANDLVNNPDGRNEMSPYFEKTETIDVSYANGCLTSNYGHPIEGYERMKLNFGWRVTSEQRKELAESRFYENKTYYIIDSMEMVDNKMNLLKSTNPDFIKIILFNSEEYLINDTIPIYNKGLNPKLLPHIIDNANRSQTRIVAHVESEFDLLASIQFGIEYIAHLPNYGFGNDGNVADEIPILSDSTLLLMKMKDIKISPTLSRTFLNVMYLPEEYRPDSLALAKIKLFHRLSLQNLRENGIEILSGADFGNATAVDEILYYDELNVFQPEELLNILINTSKHIFPNRKIGEIKEGYEANLLILSQDPSKDINAIKNIDYKFKNGKLLN